MLSFVVCAEAEKMVCVTERIKKGKPHWNRCQGLDDLEYIVRGTKVHMLS